MIKLIICTKDKLIFVTFLTIEIHCIYIFRKVTKMNIDSIYNNNLNILRYIRRNGKAISVLNQARTKKRYIERKI